MVPPAYNAKFRGPTTPPEIPTLRRSRQLRGREMQQALPIKLSSHFPHRPRRCRNIHSTIKASVT